VGFTGAAHAPDDAAEQLAAAGACDVISSMVELPATVERLMSCVKTTR